MAPPIVHFLVGASTLLLAAAIAAEWYPGVVRYRLELVLVGGVWGAAPDVHWVAPRGGDLLQALHRSRWMDLFALHWTLDQQVGRNLGNLATLLAVLGFAAVVAGFALAMRVVVDDPAGRRRA